MPNGKRSRKRRRKPSRPAIPSRAEWIWREVLPRFQQGMPSAKRSRRHMRNATIEVLEAVRALLDDTIEWLRRSNRNAAELKRIRVEG